MGRIISRLISILFIFTPFFTVSWLYMWQASEYKHRDVWRWLGRLPDLRRIQRRKKISWTAKVTLLAIACWLLYGGVLAVIVALYSQFGLLALIGVIFLPVIQLAAVPVVLYVGGVFIQRPKEKRIFNETKAVIAKHPGIKIAVAGSYGKTTMKSLLATILDEKLHVATTHGNRNTPLGIAEFVKKLDKSEDVLIFEYGEEYPGDVRHLADLTSPSIGILTGVSSAHMASFKSIEAITDTIFELTEAQTITRVYKNLASLPIRERSAGDQLGYGSVSCDGWVAEVYNSSIKGLAVTFKKGDKIVRAKTQLIGEHLVGPLLCCVAIADFLGLSTEEIAKGISYTKPFEHRMQPRQLHGALIIDDTYNGNPDGVAAGLALLKDAEASRRVYVTPGLVEQGDQTREVHVKIGEQIAESADVVVLMTNSVTEYIKQGLTKAKFQGRLIESDDPLDFYQNLEHFVAAGDVVLMQNDWTDNYA